MGGIGVKDADADVKEAKLGSKGVGSDVKKAEADVKDAEKMLRTLGPDVKNAKTVLRTLGQNVKKAMVLSSKRALRALNHGIRSEVASELRQGHGYLGMSVRIGGHGGRSADGVMAKL